MQFLLSFIAPHFLTLPIAPPWLLQCREMSLHGFSLYLLIILCPRELVSHRAGFPSLSHVFTNAALSSAVSKRAFLRLPRCRQLTQKPGFTNRPPSSRYFSKYQRFFPRHTSASCTSGPSVTIRLSDRVPITTFNFF